MSRPDQVDVVVIGGGIAGLTCAHDLVSNGVACQVIEAADHPGGRIVSDDCDGFILDRGFQVFLTEYPEARRVLDYDSLELCSFEPGALIWRDGAFHRLSDPWRRPQHAWSTATSKIGSLIDKLRIARMRRRATSGSLETLYGRPETTTLELLQRYRFSEEMIDQFFRPFLGGVFLDADLRTSSKMCEFVFRMFSVGEATLPARGMRAISQQLAGKLKEGTLRTSCRVESVAAEGVILASGEKVVAKAYVVATEQHEADQLLRRGQRAGGQPVACVYFAADRPPLEEPILMLDGEGTGPVNNLCVPSQVSSRYAPDGQALISATVLTGVANGTLVDAVTSQLRGWFGSEVDSWRHLRTYEIPYALPTQAPPHLDQVEKQVRVAEGVYRCGDYCDTGSINGAMASGRRAAEAVLQDAAVK